MLLAVALACSSPGHLRFFTCSPPGDEIYLRDRMYFFLQLIPVRFYGTHARATSWPRITMSTPCA
jgi:hypothetical protein